MTTLTLAQIDKLEATRQRYGSPPSIDPDLLAALLSDSKEAPQDEPGH